MTRLEKIAVNPGCRKRAEEILIQNFCPGDFDLSMPGGTFGDCHSGGCWSCWNTEIEEADEE